MKLSIIIPTYKQEKTIQLDLENILKTMNQTRWEYEIICVVDGFLDKTFDNASKVKDDHVKVIGYEKNRGRI